MTAIEQDIQQDRIARANLGDREQHDRIRRAVLRLYAAIWFGYDGQENWSKYLARQWGDDRSAVMCHSSLCQRQRRKHHYV